MVMNFPDSKNVGNIFADFARYDFVDKYLQALVDTIADGVIYFGPDTPSFCPFTCAVIDPYSKEGFRWVIERGRVSPSAKATIEWVKGLDVNDRHFLSNSIVINGNGSRRELFFAWDIFMPDFQ